MEILANVFAPELALAALVAVVGGGVYGYTGFGSALVMVPLLALMFGPVEAITVTAIASLIGSLQVYAGAARLARWREVGPLCAAILVATPLGVAVLFTTDPEIIRRAIGFLVLLAAGLLMSGWVYRGRRGAAAGAVAGALCGGITGAAGVGGPPVVVYFLASPDSAAVQRANVVIPVGVVAVVTVVAIGAGGGIGAETVARGIVLSPAAMLGFWTGSRLFATAPQTLYRRAAMGLLIASGLVTLVL